MNLQNILDRAKNFFNPQLKSPVPKGGMQSKFGGQPTQPIAMYRNPRMQEFADKNPKDFQEILSASQLATQDPTKRQLLMDLALEESGLRVNPPANPMSSAKGAYQYLDST